mgnify:CR=1 FL=1
MTTREEYAAAFAKSQKRRARPKASLEKRDAMLHDWRAAADARLAGWREKADAALVEHGEAMSA